MLPSLGMLGWRSAACDSDLKRKRSGSPASRARERALRTEEKLRSLHEPIQLLNELIKLLDLGPGESHVWGQVNQAAWNEQDPFTSLAGLVDWDKGDNRQWQEWFKTAVTRVDSAIRLGIYTWDETPPLEGFERVGRLQYLNVHEKVSGDRKICLVKERTNEDRQRDEETINELTEDELRNLMMLNMTLMEGGMPKLETLELSGFLRDDAMMKLSGLLEQGNMPKLEELSLRDNYITDNGIAALSAFLLQKHAKSLKRLYLEGNRGIGVKGMNSMVDALEGRENSLEHLSIDEPNSRLRIYCGKRGIQMETEGQRQVREREEREAELDAESALLDEAYEQLE